MKNYLPEGLSPERTYTCQQLLDAMKAGTILEAVAVKCDEEKNLMVDLGSGCTGIIPKNETALGVREGITKDIAIISRVGHPVAFRVEAPCGDQRFRLSRRSAQQEALHHILQHRQPGDICRAVVTGLAPFGAFCDIGCGVMALLGLESISVSRVRHPQQRFSIGDQLFVVIQNLDRTCGRITLTHRELLGTWAQNAAAFSPGQTVPGIVRSIQDYGAFVELTPNLSGLCDPDPSLQEGMSLSVYIKSIIPEKTKVKLVPISPLPNWQPQPLRYFQIAGRLDFWQYGPDSCPKIQSDFFTSSQ